MTDASAIHPHDAGHDHDHDHAHEDHGGVGKYLIVFVALCLLTSASFFTYSHYWPFGKHEAWAFMMAVSCTKAMLVIMFFMHLLWEANWKWVLTVPASCMSIFLLLMLVPDIGMRQDNGYGWYSYQRLNYTALPPAEEKTEEHDVDESAADLDHAAADHDHATGASPTH
jgi:cytochrome c oxidase subunit IV